MKKLTNKRTRFARFHPTQGEIPVDCRFPLEPVVDISRDILGNRDVPEIVAAAEFIERFCREMNIAELQLSEGSEPPDDFSPDPYWIYTNVHILQYDFKEFSTRTTKSFSNGKPHEYFAVLALEYVDSCLSFMDGTKQYRPLPPIFPARNAEEAASLATAAMCFALVARQNPFKKITKEGHEKRKRAAQRAHTATNDLRFKVQTAFTQYLRNTGKISVAGFVRKLFDKELEISKTFFSLKTPPTDETVRRWLYEISKHYG